MPSDYYINNIDYIRNRNKLSNRKYYNDNKNKILQNKRIRYKKSKICISSYFDLLPDDIQINIYKKKHELEFLPTLHLISKIKCIKIFKHRPVDFDMSLTKSPSPVCNRHLRNGLLTQVSNRNNIIIDLRLSNCYLYFFTSLSRIQAIQNRFNISIKMTYRNRQLSCNCVGCISKFVFDRANIKFNKRNNNPIIVLEIIELLLLLGIHYHDPDPYTVGKVSIDNIFSISNTRQRDVLALSTWG